MTTGVPVREERGRLEASLRSPRRPGPALVAYVVAGYPSRTRFAAVLAAVSEVADAVAVAVPTPAALADGAAFARAVDDALVDPIDLDWVLTELAVRRAHCPTVLVAPEADEALVERIVAAGIDGMLLAGDPAAPSEDRAAPLAEAARTRGLALARWVAPELPPAEITARCAAARGLLWVAGGRGVPVGALDLEAARALFDPALSNPVHEWNQDLAQRAPRCAAVGIRRPDQARRLAPHVDGLVVGSALVGVVSQGLDPRPVLEEIRAAMAPGPPAGPTPGTR